MYDRELCFTILVLLSVLGSSYENPDLDLFRKEILNVHNELRRTHNSDPLKPNTKLDKKANEFAELASTQTEFDDMTAGENIFMACTTYNRAISGREVSNAWYDEVCHPRFSFSNTDNKQARSFTQVIWKGSKEIGIGRAEKRKKDQRCTYVVVLYSPPGNIIGAFDGNVIKGTLDKEKYCKSMTEAADKLQEKVKLNKKREFNKRKQFLTKQGKGEISPNSKTSPPVFTLNRSNAKPELRRRTLYYKIPVRFVTSSKSGSTIVVPRKKKIRSFRRKPIELNGARRSPQSVIVDNPEFQFPVVDRRVSHRLGRTNRISPSQMETTRHQPMEESYDFADSYGGPRNSDEVQTRNNDEVQTNNVLGDYQTSNAEKLGNYKTYNAADIQGKPYNVADVQGTADDFQANYMKDELEKSETTERVTDGMKLLGTKKEDVEDVSTMTANTRDIDGSTKDKGLKIEVLGITH